LGEPHSHIAHEKSKNLGQRKLEGKNVADTNHAIIQDKGLQKINFIPTNEPAGHLLRTMQYTKFDITPFEGLRRKSVGLRVSGTM
jgi:hypothetical protein